MVSDTILSVEGFFGGEELRVGDGVRSRPGGCEGGCCVRVPGAEGCTVLELQACCLTVA